MPPRTYAAWHADGEPSRYAQPISDLASALLDNSPAGWELGVLGNRPHLTAKLPEDHCPFSQTGWPIASPYPFIHALDWSHEDRSYVRQFRWWVSEARAGRARWVKYINIDGRHHSFQPGYAVRPSSDDPSHGHLSIRSDWTHRPATYGWVTVRRGNTGSAVAALQSIANGHGAGLTVDGRFGPRTDRWVRGFQERRELVVDGIAGPVTRWSTFVL